MTDRGMKNKRMPLWKLQVSGSIQFNSIQFYYSHFINYLHYI